MSPDTTSPARGRYCLRSSHASSEISRTRKQSKTSPSKLSSPSSHQKIVNCMQKASQKMSQKHVTVKKVKATPWEKAKKKDRKSCPCPLLPVTRSSSDSPQPPSMHTSSPSTAAKCMSGQESSTLGTKSTIKNQSALSTHTPVGDSGQCTRREICIKTGEYKGSYEVMCRKAEIEWCQRTQKGDLQLVIPYTKAEESYLRSMEKAIQKWVNSTK